MSDTDTPVVLPTTLTRPGSIVPRPLRVSGVEPRHKTHNHLTSTILTWLVRWWVVYHPQGCTNDLLTQLVD